MPQLPQLPQLPEIALRGNGGSPKKSLASCGLTATTATAPGWCAALALPAERTRAYVLRCSVAVAALMLRCSMPGPWHVSEHSLGRMLSVRIVSVLTMCVRTWWAGIVSVLMVSVRKGGYTND
jgi:hypothetical protein